MKHGRAGAEETATDAHLRGDSTKKALDPRDDGAYLVAKAHELNHTNMYIFDVRSLRPHRSEDEVNPHPCALCWGLADILAHSKALTRSCSMGFCSFTSCY